MKQSAFNLNLSVIILMLVSGLLSNMMIFYIISVMLLLILPACSTDSPNKDSTSLE